VDQKGLQVEGHAHCVRRQQNAAESVELSSIDGFDVQGLKRIPNVVFRGMVVSFGVWSC
jgi:hypothetical protein